jgi:hypothetical protein
MTGPSGERSSVGVSLTAATNLRSGRGTDDDRMGGLTAGDAVLLVRRTPGGEGYPAAVVMAHDFDAPWDAA